MPLHTNGHKDLISLRIVVVTMCTLAILLSSAMAWITAHGNSAPECLVASVAAVIGALCAVLGIATFRSSRQPGNRDAEFRDTDGPDQPGRR